MPLEKTRLETYGVKHGAAAAAPHRLFLGHLQHVSTDDRHHRKSTIGHS
jgi:hypothetical protein